MRTRDHNPFTNAISLLICGLLAGVVVAAAAFPAVAMSGLAAKAGAEAFGKLPSALTVKTAPQISYFYASDGKTLLATMYDENRRDIPLKDVAPIMQKAIIAAEDHDFFKHNGIDPKGAVRAFVANNSAGTTTQGASTLTMQYVRLAIAYSANHPQDVVAATEDTAARKVKEMKYAVQLEKELTKDQILERYLNIAPFGNGAYGIFAASQVYFSKHPRHLKIEEAAMLAGMVKAPSAFDPTTKGGYPQAVDRRNYVIQNMDEIGAISHQQAVAAMKIKLTVTGKRAPNGCVAANRNHWGFFCDYVYRWWLSQETFGATGYERERRLKSGGYRIITTLDVPTQEAAKRNVEARLKTGHKEALMLAAVEPGSGRVRALAVNRNFRLDSAGQNGINSDPAKRKLNIRGTYPNTTNPLVTGGGAVPGYQGGSTFKMFTLVAALEKGYPLEYTINAPPVYQSKYIIEYNAPAACPNTNKYCPQNYDKKVAGLHNMWTAFGNSVNTYFVPLQERVGAANVVDVAKRLGVKFRDGDDAFRTTEKGGVDQWGAFTLGVSATTPLDLANAYATLAADGKHCEPIPVQEIRGQDGKKLDIANPRCDQAVSPAIARAAVDAARCPVGDRSATSKCKGTTARMTRQVVDRPVAGKTGTTDDDKTASLIAMTKQLAVAGMLADPDWAETTEKMDHGIVNPAVWETLRDAMRSKPGIEFTAPNGKILTGEQRSIPVVTCNPIDRARERLEAAGFVVDVDRIPIDSSCPANTVARTNPDGRTIKGGTVVIQISNGKAVPLPGPMPTPTPKKRGSGDGPIIIIPPPPG